MIGMLASVAPAMIRPKSVLASRLHFGNAQRDGELALGVEHNQLQEIVVPGGDEGEDGQRSHAGLDQGEYGVNERAYFSRSIDARCLQHFVWECFQKTASSGIRRRASLPSGKITAHRVLCRFEPRHFLEQRDHDDLFGQRHGADKQAEDKPAARQSCFLASA